jgi:hypothetical protein
MYTNFKIKDSAAQTRRNTLLFITFEPINIETSDRYQYVSMCFDYMTLDTVGQPVRFVLGLMSLRISWCSSSSYFQNVQSLLYWTEILLQDVWELKYHVHNIVSWWGREGLDIFSLIITCWILASCVKW